MKKIDKRTEKRKIGDMGENIANDYLIKRGFEIVERNYLRKWGEIDIIAKKDCILHFVEVKTVSCVTLHRIYTGQGRDTTYRPEENVHPYKIKRLNRAIQTYLLENNLECDWQLDVVSIRLNKHIKKARVDIIENALI